ncbi:t-SNARE domain-containing protein 1 [Mactra antiquata]
MAAVIGKGSFKGFGETHDKEGDGADNLPLDKAIGNKLQTISYNVNQLKKLNEYIGTSMDTADMRNKMSDLIAETHQITKDTNELMKKFSESEPTDPGLQTKWKIQVRRLKELFHDQLTDYHSIQKEIRNNERKAIRTSLQQSGCFDIEVDESGSFVKDGQQIQVETIKAEVDLDLIKDREKALKQLEQDIVDVNHIFKDLAVMIQDQGEMIDEAEKNVEHVVDDVEVVVQDLHEASDNMSSTRRKRICVGVVVAAGVAIIVLIIVLTQVT